MEIALTQATIIIFTTTLLASILGCYIGKAFGTRWRTAATLAGGVILIAIGAKILLEHTLFA